MESVARVSALMDPARASKLDTIQTASSSKTLRPSAATRTIPAQKLKALLDSRSDRDILDGLKRVVAMIYMNKPALSYFSSVVKNVANSNIEVKKLVYIYLMHYAESDPDLALLSVNAIQKSLSDQSPQVRALALKTMSGMRVPVISQIVFLAVKKGITDLSPHVRKAAVLAIPKCYKLDPNTLPQLLDCLSLALGDKQYFVVGPAVQVFLELCPDRVDLLHKHYRALVRKLVDMDEWSQLATLQTLLYYARRCFSRPEDPTAKTAASDQAGKDFYDDTNDPIEIINKSTLDPDLESLLKTSQLLLTSRNAAVVLAAASNLIYLGGSIHKTAAIGPLIALLRTSPEVSATVLPSIISIILQQPDLAVPYISSFLPTSTDPLATSLLKLEALTVMFPHTSANHRNLILAELSYHVNSISPTLSTEAIRALSRCATAHPASIPQIFRILLSQVQSLQHHDQSIISETLTVIRYLIQQDPSAHRKTVVRLARNLDKTVSPEARATIIWLVGEFIDPDNNIAPDVLRILLKDFANEPEAAKQQILLLGAKIYLSYLIEHGETGVNDSDSIPSLWQYLLLLVRYDVSYDLRDRARLFRSLLSTPESTQLATLLIQAPKPVPLNPSPSEHKQDITLGTTTLTIGADTAHGLSGYMPLPPWADPSDVPDPSIRDEDVVEEYVSQHGGAAEVGAAAVRLDQIVKEQGLEKAVRAKTGQKTLDAWLDDDDDDDDDESADESEESEGSSEAESSEEETTDEESD